MLASEPLYGKTERSAESNWELEGEDLELGMALDPVSYAAKLMQMKRKPDPSLEGEKPPIRRRPDTPPSGARPGDSPAASEHEHLNQHLPWNR